MNTLNLDRLAAVLSGILSDRYGKQIAVTLEGKDVNNDPDCHGTDSFGSAQLHSLHDAV